ncbi:hypothetical protein FZEAL_7072 [Fusarium zealandicum]|uniref:GH16 domain-containing protein n=1 Tax=Fusarium zealandicum TaxID=1053134 RepID=A0A8H4UHJ4_9HYPO|nr:hypothetical protein FZEAL_7072 [Fusarium zealandicum]
MVQKSLLVQALLFLGTNACNGGGGHAVTYSLKKMYDASNFLDSFNFRDLTYYIWRAYYDSINPDYGGDPTGGFVNYMSQKDALASGIVNTKNGKVYLGVDSNKRAILLDSSTTRHGRDSVRLESKETWDSGILIADIEHMPGTACGIWPSYWLYKFDEDLVGEIDIIEGINLQDANVVSLHTCGACSFSNIGGIDGRSNCNNGGTVSQQCEDGTNLDGCGNTVSTGSYGETSNSKQGGVLVTWIATDAVKLYWWPRAKIPADITSGKPSPSSWGTHASQFVGLLVVATVMLESILRTDYCNASLSARPRQNHCANDGGEQIFNTAFCGSNIDHDTWNGDCKATTGAETCDDYVTNSPAAFNETFWSINSVKLYQ